MKRILLMILLISGLVYSDSIHAQNSTKKKSYSKKSTSSKTPKVYIALEPKEIETHLKKIRKEIVSGKVNKEKINHLHIRIDILYLNSLIEHPGLEYKTRISEEWYKKLQQYLKAMYKSKELMHDYSLTNDKQNYLAANASYRKNAKAFLALVKKPKTLGEDEYKKAKEKYQNFMKKQREMAKD
jgi:hypothetical protein